MKGYMVRLFCDGPLKNPSTRARGPAFSVEIKACAACVLTKVRIDAKVEQMAQEGMESLCCQICGAVVDQ